MRPLDTLTGLEGVRIVEHEWMAPGSFYVMAPNTCLVRHLSELFLWMRSATWHVERTNCPTWDESTECRCMTEPP